MDRHEVTVRAAGGVTVLGSAKADLTSSTANTGDWFLLEREAYNETDRAHSHI